MAYQRAQGQGAAPSQHYNLMQRHSARRSLPFPYIRSLPDPYLHSLIMLAGITRRALLRT